MTASERSLGRLASLMTDVDFPQLGKTTPVRQRGTRYRRTVAFLASFVVSRQYMYYSSWSGLGSFGGLVPFLISGAKGGRFSENRGKKTRTRILAFLDWWFEGKSGTPKSVAKLNNMKMVRKNS